MRECTTMKDPKLLKLLQVKSLADHRRPPEATGASIQVEPLYQEADLLLSCLIRTYGEILSRIAETDLQVDETDNTLRRALDHIQGQHGQPARTL